MDTELVDDLPFSAEKKRYILETLEPVLEEMVANVVTEMPSEPLEYMIEWLTKKSGAGIRHGRKSIHQTNKKLKQSLKEVTGTLNDLAAGFEVDKGEDDDGDDNVEGHEDIDEVPVSHKMSDVERKKSRKSVSAEVYGEWNQKPQFVAPQHHKSSDQKNRLRETLDKSFMFQNLDEKDMESILLAMSEKQVLAGATVITEGEAGDFLFVVEKGSMECSKIVDGEKKVLRICKDGDVFGEMALLYNCPRSASVTAQEPSTCWMLDRETFNHVVRDASVRRRDKYDEFLKSVSLLQSLGSYERSQISDVLVSEWFDKGTEIVREGDPGDKFYFLETGQLNATKLLDGNPQNVMHYKPGDYFGELALLNNKPRAATVVVVSDQAKVVSMTRTSFSNLLGPLQTILAKGAEKYG
jgi:cAMP-dependent protein kinase regulator